MSVSTVQHTKLQCNHTNTTHLLQKQTEPSGKDKKVVYTSSKKENVSSPPPQKGRPPLKWQKYVQSSGAGGVGGVAASPRGSWHPLSKNQMISPSPWKVFPNNPLKSSYSILPTRSVFIRPLITRPPCWSGPLVGRSAPHDSLK